MILKPGKNNVNFGDAPYATRSRRVMYLFGSI